MPEQKEIKLRLITQKSDFDTANRLIKDLTDNIANLVKVAGDAAKSIAGLGGKTSPGFSSNQTTPGTSGGTNSTGVTTSASAGISMGGMANGLMSVLRGNQSVLKGLASGSKDLMKDMTSALKAGTQSAIQDLERLTRSYHAAADAMKDLSGGKLDFNRMSPSVRKDIFEGMEGVVSKQGEVKRLQQMANIVGFESSWGGRYLGMGANIARTQAARIAGMLGGEGMAEGAYAAMSSGVGAAIGGVLGTGVLAVGAGVAGWKMYQHYQGTVNDQILRGTSNETYATKNIAMRQETGQLANRIQFGDYSQTWGLHNALKDPKIQTHISQMVEERARAMEGKAGAEYYSNLTNMSFEESAKYLSSGAHGGMTTFDAAKLAADPTVGREIVHQADLWLGANPMLRNEKGGPGAAFHDMQAGQYAARRAGSYASGVPLWSKKPGSIDIVNGEVVFTKPKWEQPYEKMIAPWRDRGLDQAFLGMMGGIEGIAGRGIAHRMAGSALEASLGGLTNAAQIAGMGSIYGGKGFFGAVTGMHGAGSKGGLDAGAVNIVGSLATSMLASGGAPTGGLGMLGAFQAMGATGSAAGDMRNALAFQKGTQGFSNLYQGNQDPFQTGLNTLNAIAAAPTASIYGQDFLATKMNQGQISDIMAGGKVPQELLDRGITGASVEGFQKATARSVLGRYIDTGMNTNEDQFVKKLAGYGGDFRAYVAAGSAGLKGKGLRAFNERAVQQYGEILEDTGFAADNEAARGMAIGMGGLGHKVSRKGGMGAALTTKDPEGTIEGAAALREFAKILGENRDTLAKSPQLFASFSATLGAIKFDELGNQTNSLIKGFQELKEVMFTIVEASDPASKAAHIADEVSNLANYTTALNYYKGKGDFQRISDLGNAWAAKQKGRTDGPMKLGRYPGMKY